MQAVATTRGVEAQLIHYQLGTRGEHIAEVLLQGRLGGGIQTLLGIQLQVLQQGIELGQGRAVELAVVAAQGRLAQGLAGDVEPAEAGVERARQLLTLLPGVALELQIPQLDRGLAGHGQQQAAEAQLTRAEPEAIGIAAVVAGQAEAFGLQLGPALRRAHIEAELADLAVQAQPAGLHVGSEGGGQAGEGHRALGLVQVQGGQGQTAVHRAVVAQGGVELHGFGALGQGEEIGGERRARQGDAVDRHDRRQLQGFEAGQGEGAVLDVVEHPQHLHRRSILGLHAQTEGGGAAEDTAL